MHAVPLLNIKMIMRLLLFLLLPQILEIFVALSLLGLLLICMDVSSVAVITHQPFDSTRTIAFLVSEREAGPSIWSHGLFIKQFFRRSASWRFIFCRHGRDGFLLFLGIGLECELGSLDPCLFDWLSLILLELCLLHEFLSCLGNVLKHFFLLYLKHDVAIHRHLLIS